MNITGNERLSDLLAAEYAVGTLRGGAKRRFERLLRTDPALAQRVADWQERLVPLALAAPAVAPPGRVWTAVARRLPGSKASAPTGFWAALGFWRGLSGALALAVVVALGWPIWQAQRAAPPSDMIATIDDPQSHRPVAVMVMGKDSKELVFKLIGSEVDVPKDRVLQLWMSAPSGAGVVSAGFVPVVPSPGEPVRFVLPDPDQFRRAAVVALSLEPPGGSPKATHLLGVGHWAPVAG